MAKSNITLIYSYLFNAQDDLNNKLMVCNKINGLFRGGEPFQIVPNISKVLGESGEIPPYEHYVEHYAYLVDLQLERSENCPNVAEVLNLVDKEHTAILTREIADEITKKLQTAKDTDETSDIISKLSVILTKHNTTPEGSTDLRKPTELYAARKTKSQGILTGLEPVDNLTYSLELGTISVIAGSPGHGKTTVARSIMYNNLTALGYNTLFVSLEMPRELILYNILAKHSCNPIFKDMGAPVPVESIQRCELTVEQEQFLEQVEYDLYNNENYGKFEVVGQDFFRNFTEFGLRSAIQRLPFKPDLIIIDYIQLLQYVNHPTELIRLKLGEPVNYYIQQLRGIAGNVDGHGKPCHIMLLSQFNREGIKLGDATEGKIPMSALAQFNELERTPSYIVMLWNNEVLRDNNETSVFLVKNRTGCTMVDPVIVHFDPRYNSVGNEINPNQTSIPIDDLIEN